MKRLLILLAVCAMTVACSDSKKEQSSEAIDVLNKAYSLLDRGKTKEAAKLINKFEDKYDMMGENFRNKADRDLEQWIENNPEKYEALCDIL